MRTSISVICVLLIAVAASAADRVVGSVTTVAGVPGLAGFSDGPLAVATFNRPTWVDVTLPSGSPVHPGDIVVVDRGNQSIRRISATAVSTYRVAYLNQPSYVAFDFGGPLGGGIVVEPPHSGCGSGQYDSGFFVSSSGSEQLMLVSMAGTLAARDDVFPLIGRANEPGSRDGTAGYAYSNLNEAQFRTPTGLARSWIYADPFPFSTRRLYVADTGNHTIRQIRFTGSFEGCPQTRVVETIAGAAGQAGSVDGAAVAARFNGPRGVAAGPDGSVFVADTGNHAIRRIASDGTVTTIAGEPGVPGLDDGVARSAHLNNPSGIDVNAKGEIFIADTGNHTIRMITTDGRLVTLAGVPGVAGFADGLASSARFSGPVGVRIAPDGTLLVADTSNNVIRRVSLASVPDNRERAIRH
jgi:sugar lactone lactonase YvrE